MISGMVIDLCLCIRLLIPALGLRSLQYRLLLVVGDRMPVNDQTVELKTQELVFIGNMFVDPPQMARYATFVETNHMISTEPAKSIWRALYLYYTKYNALPDECDFVSVFGEKGSENLELGIAVAGSEETRASFILDTFADTMKANVFKQVSSKLAEIYEDGKVDNDKARKAIDSVYTKLSIIERAASNTEEGDMASVFETWMDGKLQMQKPRIPIPIPGLGFMAGTPVGSVNVIVGSYGSGKTSSLCTMAAELCKKHNVLYVTLETPAESLAFRVMSNCTGGAVPSSYVFLDPRAVDDNERDAVKYAKEAARTEIKNRHNVYFLDLPAGEVSPAQLALYLRNLHFREKVNIPVMIIDYAALMKTNAGTGREEIGWGYTGVILKELSAVAKSLGITIWVAAQAGGEKAHTVTTSNPTNFKPMRGNDLYGSKEVLQDASLVLGLSFLRSRDHPRLAAGVISTIKNRYGEEFYDFACTMDYSKSTIKSLGVLPNEGDGDCVDIVTDLLRATELELEQMNKLQRKVKAEKVMVPMYKRPDRPHALYVNQAKKPTPVAKTPPKAIQQGEMNSQDAMY